jgi:hypothetical protein
VLGIGRRVRAAKNASRGEPAKRRNCQKSTRLPVYFAVPASPRLWGVFPRRGRGSPGGEARGARPRPTAFKGGCAAEYAADACQSKLGPIIDERLLIFQPEFAGALAGMEPRYASTVSEECNGIAGCYPR